MNTGAIIATLVAVAICVGVAIWVAIKNKNNPN